MASQQVTVDFFYFVNHGEGLMFNGGVILFPCVELVTRERDGEIESSNPRLGSIV